MDTERFNLAIAAFDRENSRDPTLVPEAAKNWPRELLQAHRYSAWLDKFAPDASEALRLAVRCQHICRWERPRSLYPEGRIGYLSWRKDLSRFHAERASSLLQEVGYDEATIERVRDLNLKKGLKLNPDAQTLEDVLCLSFIEHELSLFSRKHPRDKVCDIIAKTWRKMSAAAQQVALTISLEPETQSVVLEALSVRES